MMSYLLWTIGSLAILGGVLYLGDRVQQLLTPTTTPLTGATRNG